MCEICFPGFSPFGQARAQFNIVWQRYSLNSSLMASNLSLVYSSRLSLIHLHIRAWLRDFINSEGNQFTFSRTTHILKHFSNISMRIKLVSDTYSYPTLKIKSENVSLNNVRKNKTKKGKGKGQRSISKKLLSVL